MWSRNISLKGKRNIQKVSVALRFFCGDGVFREGSKSRDKVVFDNKAYRGDLGVGCCTFCGGDDNREVFVFSEATTQKENNEEKNEVLVFHIAPLLDF